MTGACAPRLFKPKHDRTCQLDYSVSCAVKHVSIHECILLLVTVDCLRRQNAELEHDELQTYDFLDFLDFLVLEAVVFDNLGIR